MIVPVGPFHKAPVGGGVLGFPSPLQFPNLELYLNSKLGIAGNDGDRIHTWPDQSGKVRNAVGAGEFDAVYRTIQANGASPNGSPTLQTDGFDAPFRQFWLNNSPNLNPWPGLTNGYSFYWVLNPRLPNSSSTNQALWMEGGTSRFRIYLEQTGVYALVDEAGAGTPRATTRAFQTGWQSGRAIIHGPSPGTADMYLNGTLLTWAGTNVITLNTALCIGYVLDQLGLNNVEGLNSFQGAFVWFSVAHPLSTQKLIDNYLRWSFGLSLI